MSTDRDHAKETLDNKERQYSYNFDDVLRGYTMRTLEPFLGQGRALEMGCYKGAITTLLDERYDHLTVIEAVESLIGEVQDKVSDDVTFVKSTFEDATLTNKFDAVFLMQTLEHLDDPVSVLRKINGWLSDTGRLFVVVPNANAPSRQIAVKMGLISHNTAVTEGERQHGHRCTYTFDTLERDVRLSGLNIVQSGGVFFKALANFQFDKLANLDVISQEYLEGCYLLGQQCPDLCANIYLVCEKGSL